MVPELQSRLSGYVQALEGASEELLGEWLSVKYTEAAGPLRLVMAVRAQTLESLRQSKFFARRVRDMVQDLYGYRGDIELQRWSDDPPF